MAQNKFWNALIEIDLEFTQQYAKILAESDPEIATLQNLLLVLNQNLRTPGKSSQAGDEAERARIQLDLKKRFANAKKNCKSSIDFLEATRKTRVRNYPTPELWWCHREDVVARYEGARTKSFNGGGALKFHRFTGNGSVRLRFGHGGITFSKIETGQTTLATLRDPTPNELGCMKAQKADGGGRKILTVRVGKSLGGPAPTLQFLITLPGRGPANGPQFSPGLSLKMIYLHFKDDLRRGAWRVSFVLSCSQVASIHEHPEAVGRVLLMNQPIMNDSGWVIGVFVKQNGSSKEKIIFSPTALVRHNESRRMIDRIDESAAVFWQTVREKTSALVLAAEHEWFEKNVFSMRACERPTHSRIMSFFAAHLRANLPFGEQIQSHFLAWYRANRLDIMRAHDLREKGARIRDHHYRNLAATMVKSSGVIRIARCPDALQSMGVPSREIQGYLSVASLYRFIAEACAKARTELIPCSAVECAELLECVFGKQ